MALKAVLATLDGLDDAFLPLYTKGEDGSFYLNIEDIKGHPSTKPLATTLEKLKRENKAALDAAKAYEGVDVERYRELVEAAENADKTGTPDEAKAAKAELEKLKQRLEQQHSVEMSKKDGIIAEMNASIRKFVLDGGLSAAIDKIGVKPEYRAAVKALMREKKIEVNKEGDEYVGVFRTDLGDIPIAEFVQSWSTSDEATHYLPPDRKAGSGTPSNSNRSGSNNTTTFDRNDPVAWGQNLDKMLKGEASAK